MSHQLRVTGGPAAGQVLPVSPGYLYSIGRGAEAQLSIPQDTTLSRAHAELYFDQTNNAWLLKNKSQHGTLLNGEVFNDHRYVQPGMSFQVGGSTIAFDVAGAPAPAQPVQPQPALGGGAPQPAMGGAPGHPGMDPTMGGAPAHPGMDPAMGAAPGHPGMDPAMGGAPGHPGMDPAMAGHPAGAPAGDPGAVGGPVGGGGPGMGAAAKDGAAAAGDAAGAAFGAAAGALGKLGTEGGGAVAIQHSGEGYPFKELVMGGLSIVRSNLVPSLALTAPMFVIIVLMIGLGFVSTTVASLVSLLFPIYSLALGLLLVPNYFIAVKNFQETSAPITIGSLMDFSNLPLKIKAGICGWAGSLVLGLGGYAYFIQLENPNAGPVDCIKLGYKYGIANLVPTIILGIIVGVVAQLSAIACGVGVMVGVPTALAAYYLAWTLKKNDVIALAASEGISLG